MLWLALLWAAGVFTLGVLIALAAWECHRCGRLNRCNDLTCPDCGAPQHDRPKPTRKEVPMTPKIEVLVGMIASGKSTYARQRADEGALVVSHDALTAMLHARYRYEEGLRATYARTLRAVAYNALRGGRDVVIDRTHLTRASRAAWLDLGKLLSAPVIAVVFETHSAEEHARRRHAHDARGRSLADWRAVAEHHEEQLHAEPLTIAEGFAAIIDGPAEPASPIETNVAEAP